MNLDEQTVREALNSLQGKRLAGPASGADSRVTKYEHRSQEVFNLTRGETALLCVLLLRGPQTPGELRGRSERLHRFETLDDVHATLQRMTERDPALVTMLPRVPGTKESRFAHLLSGKVEKYEPSVPAAAESSPHAERIGRLEEEVAGLRRDLSDLRDQVERFRKQFE